MLGADHKGRYNFAACLGSMPGCGGLATKKKTISDCHIVDSCPHTLSSQGLWFGVRHFDRAAPYASSFNAQYRRSLARDISHENVGTSFHFAVRFF